MIPKASGRGWMTPPSRLPSNDPASRSESSSSTSSTHGSMRATTSGPRSGLARLPAISSEMMVMWPVCRSSRYRSVAMRIRSSIVPGRRTASRYRAIRSALVRSRAASSRSFSVPKW